jgi:glycosyltransferase involved in cell wall biosynthesis
MPNKLRTISIVIPAYNEERHLGACLESIAQQTFQPDEVIVVDNNSTDPTVQFAQNFPFVKVVPEPRQGIVYARNAGFNAAKGDIIGRIDADTILPKKWVETLLNEAEHHLATMAFTGPGVFYDAPWSRLLSKMQVWAYQYLQFPAMRGFTLWGANMGLRREAWEAVRTFCSERTDIDEDIDLSLLLHERGQTVRYTPHLMAQMSLRRNQISPVQVALYMSTWPRNYFIHRRFLAALYISIVTGVVIICSWVAWLLLLFRRQR